MLPTRTFTELLTLDEFHELIEGDTLPDGRYELAEGRLVMVPAPAFRHQAVVATLIAELNARLPRELMALPGAEVVVQPVFPATARVPDVLVVPSRLAEEGAKRCAASDVVLAVEIVSPGSRRSDRVLKLNEYEEAGVPHYWIVDLDAPEERFLELELDPRTRRYRVASTSSRAIGVSDPVALSIEIDALWRR